MTVTCRPHCSLVGQVSVPLGDRIFRDRLEWAVGQPHNVPECYAAGVCSELGLDWQDAKAIADAMRQQVASLPPVSISVVLCTTSAQSHLTCCILLCGVLSGLLSPDGCNVLTASLMDPQQQEAPYQGPCMHKPRQVEKASLFASYPRLDLK